MEAGVNHAVELDHEFGPIKQFTEVQHTIHIKHKASRCTEWHDDGEISLAR